MSILTGKWFVHFASSASSCDASAGGVDGQSLFCSVYHSHALIGTMVKSGLTAEFTRRRNARDYLAGKA